MNEVKLFDYFTNGSFKVERSAPFAAFIATTFD